MAIYYSIDHLKNAFDSRIASCVMASSEKLYYLDQYLLGEPKEMISSCFYLDCDVGYGEARNLLEAEYGDSYKVAMLYLAKICEWPIVKPVDNVGLRKFALFLTQCSRAMNSVTFECSQSPT